MPYLIGVMGPTCSGKTSLCRVLSREMGVESLSMDDFFVDKGDYPIEQGFMNMDSPQSVDFDSLFETLLVLKRGEPVRVPVYDKEKSIRTGNRLMTPQETVFSEGFLLFYDPRIREMLDLKIYLELASVKQLERRKTRGVYADEEYFRRIVLPAFETYGRPLMRYADHILDAAEPFEEVLGKVKRIVQNARRGELSA